MKTKQIIPLIGILILGILIGKFAFSSSSSKNTNAIHKNETAEEHWTCSMHPQIDLPESGSCPICGMDLILKETGNSNDVASNSFKMTKNAIALANIQTLVIGGQSKNMNDNSLNLSGKIMANEKATAIQTSHFGGRIEKLYYKSVGEFVRKGSLVATVYSPELVTAQNEFIEVLNIKKSQPELYNAIKNKLKNWKISAKQIQQIEQTKKVMTNFNMYANVSGYVDQILVKEGNHVKEGAPLFKVSNLASVWAMFDVYEQDIKNVKIGQQIRIKSNAYPNEIIKAKINFIDPNLDVSTRTVQVRATLKNTKTKLKPGMLLVGKVTVKHTATKGKSRRIMVPKTAVMWTGKRSVIYIKASKNDPIFELREITLGNSAGNSYEVIEGLTNGEEVVVNGTFTVDAAAQLRGKPSMMNVKTKSKKSEVKKGEIKRIVINSKFKEQLNVVLTNYFKLKDAFVLTDVAKVTKQATKTLASFKKVDMGLLKNLEAHKVWMPAVTKMNTALQGIVKETTIKNQRAQFVSLSNAMVTVISSFGAGKEEVYVIHCPMANNNKGADWLSLDKTVKNPYYGQKMLTCGSVEYTIK